tara:strand:- start:332 stop:451 length:120 start_codon:yes stop_codon:yes gene_type:complete
MLWGLFIPPVCLFISIVKGMVTSSGDENLLNGEKIKDEK